MKKLFPHLQIFDERKQSIMTKWKPLRKQTFIFLIALFICLGFAEPSAFAADESITLSHSEAQSYVIQDGQRVTLDLQSYTLSNSGNSSATITVNAGGELLIKGTGQIVNQCEGGSALVNYGDVTILGGTFTCTEHTETDKCVIENYGVMSITGGEFTNSSDSAAVVTNHEKARMTISGGEFCQNDFVVILNESRDGFEFTGSAVIQSDPCTEAFRNTGIASFSGGSLCGSLMSVGSDNEEAVTTISGGQITGDVVRAVGDASKASVYVKNNPVITLETGLGTYVRDGSRYKKTSDPSRASIMVSGGVFTTPVSFDYLDPHFRQTQREDGAFVFEPLTADTAAASISAADGSLQYFNSLDKAILAASKGSVVKMQTDTTADLSIPADQDIFGFKRSHTNRLYPE